MGINQSVPSSPIYFGLIDKKSAKLRTYLKNSKTFKKVTPDFLAKYPKNRPFLEEIINKTQTIDSF